MDQWIDNASFGHFWKLFGAGLAAGFFGTIFYMYVIAMAEAKLSIQATGQV